MNKTVVDCEECAAGLPVDIFADGRRIHIHGGHAASCTGGKMEPGFYWAVVDDRYGDGNIVPPHGRASIT